MPWGVGLPRKALGALRRFVSGPACQGHWGGSAGPVGGVCFWAQGQSLGGSQNKRHFSRGTRQSLIPGGPRKGPPPLGPGRGRALPDEQRSTLGEPAIVWRCVTPPCHVVLVMLGFGYV